jgi:hypothetical protein
MQQTEVVAIELPEYRVNCFEFEAGVAKWSNIPADHLAGKDLAEGNLLLGDLHFQT